ncbi:MAG: magnesium chelatase subunit D [Burkholderiales bacterium]|nr:magnesium chelatase subunit D [Burkholderiales bacterium]
MTPGSDSPSIPVSEAAAAAWLAVRLFAIDPAALGGIVVRAAAGPVRDRWLADLRAALPAGTPWRAVPVHVDEERLLGGIDLAATLQGGRPVAQRGVLAESDGGVVLLAMAERAARATVAHLAAALDQGEVVCARDGIALREPARFGVLALDESAEDDAPVSDVLLDRCAFHVDLRAVAWRELEHLRDEPARVGIAAARALYPRVIAEAPVVEALCAAAQALGVMSVRACLFALRAARLAAASAGRTTVSDEDATLAARLVLGPRATRLPAPPEQSEDQAAESEAADRSENDSEESADAARDATADAEDAADPPGPTEPAAEALDDRVLAAAAAAIPAGLLARLTALDARGMTRLASGRAGALQKSRNRGRPAGVRRERPRGGARLDVIATLRAAVPWQKLRGRESSAPTAGEGASPLRIRAEDFHVGRFKQRGRTTTVFAVDASGSSALHRLAEAKGAVELLLAECYVRRDSVAVIGFRGRDAELLLPPTRSLVRAKRSLAELPGGGGTPLAAGLDAARELAVALRRRGETPVVVVLSDGRANVARDGSPGRPRAEAEARGAARTIREEGVVALFIDTSAQPHPLARELATEMGARYLPLPHAEAASLSAAVRSAALPGERRR